MPVSREHHPAPHNPTGRNQHGKSILDNYEFWCPIVQGYLDEGVKQTEMSEKIAKDHDGVEISKRSIERLISKHKLKTSRQPRMYATELGAAVLELTEQDGLATWGYRRIQEALKLKGTHVPRPFIEDFQRVRDAEEASNRFTSKQKIVRRGLVSPGPNEEWCVDGHEKLKERMGIEVYGIIDKYSRMELGTWAVPNSRLAIVPPALFLMLVKEKKGIPLQITSDKGSETGQLAALQTALRTHYEPGLSTDDLPPHRFVTSVRNITRERAWRPLWHKDLKNVLLAWEEGQLNVGYSDGNPTHRMIGIWLWARVVQLRLDDTCRLNAVHRVRLQRKVLLPTGGRITDFYNNPEKYGGQDMLIRVDEDDIDRLIAEHVPARIFQFGSDESHALATALYEQIGSPRLDSLNAWAVWRQMMDLIESVETEVA